MTYYGNDADCYQGQWCLGMPWGRGARYWPSGNIYDGQWGRGLPHGDGSKLWADKMIFYRGEFEEGVPVRDRLVSQGQSVVTISTKLLC